MTSSPEESNGNPIKNEEYWSKRCHRCEILVIGDPLHLPPRWKWEVNGKNGLLCNGCAKDIARIYEKKKNAKANRIQRTRGL